MMNDMRYILVSGSIFETDLSLGQNDGYQFVEIEGTFFVQLNDLSALKINA